MDVFDANANSADIHPANAAANHKSLQNLTQIIYGLQAIGFFIGITYFAALIINYIKWDEAKGTWLESHFRWQIRTFWYSVLWTCIGVITFALLIGYFVLCANYLWVIYRIAKGWLDLRANKPMYNPS